MKNDPNGFKYNDQVRIFDKNQNFVAGQIKHVENGIVSVYVLESVYFFEDSDDVKIGYDEDSGWYWKVHLENVTV